MQRRYRQKKYHCGEYVEVAIYPVYTKAKGRGKRCKPTSEIQKRLNQRHAEGKLRRLLHTNFTPSDLFATLTFDDAHLPAAPEDAQRHRRSGVPTQNLFLHLVGDDVPRSFPTC